MAGTGSAPGGRRAAVPAAHKSAVAEFYAGRDILVTGASGFMGKVLLEKLLRSCPDLKRIFIVIRAKRGVAPQARVDAMARLPLFEPLLRQRPDALRQVVALPGDVSAPGLGLADGDRRLVRDTVSVVFHLAASLRLEAAMKDAVVANTEGTKTVLDFCKDIGKLVSLVYVSTAFCHCEEAVLEERVYPCHEDPHRVMQLCRTLSDSQLLQLTPKLLGPHPNCYTFSKRLAETLVEEYSRTMPIAIARPSIVTPSYQAPFPGWVDSLNGPTGIIVGAGKGVIRSMMCDGSHHAEVVPVDVCINALILVAFRRGTSASAAAAPREVPVYNVSQNDVVRVTWGEVLRQGREALAEFPFDWAVWHPDGSIRTNWLSHTLIVFFFQTVPAYLIDLLLTLAWQRRFMVRVQKRIAVGMEVLQYFTMRDWDFKNRNTLGLLRGLSQQDREDFFIDNIDVDVGQYLKHTVLGSRVYCLKEPLSSLPTARRHAKVLWCIHRTFVFLFFALCGWLLLRAAQWLFTLLA